MTDYLLKNAYFPFDQSVKNLYIEDGIVKKIVENIKDKQYIRPDRKYCSVDLQKRIIIPGFVDAHTHFDKALISKNVINKSGTLNEAIQLMGKYKKNMTKEEVKEKATEAIKMSIEQGTKYVRTHIDIDEEVGLESLEGLIELKEQFKEDIAIQLIAFPQEGIENNINLVLLEKALQAGADVVGGIPALAEDPIKHIETIFDLAIKYDVDIDMHIDETDDPNSLTIKHLLQATKDYKYEGRVTAGHLCSLAAYENSELIPLVEEIEKAGVNIISLPSTNLYLQGRHDSKLTRRGIAPIKFLHAKNLSVMIGSDNNQDPFNPFGNGSMLVEALIAAHGCHMGGKEDLETLFDMVTIIPGQKLFEYSITEGNKANFIVLDTYSKARAIIEQAKIYGKFHNSKFLMNTNNYTEADRTIE